MGGFFAVASKKECIVDLYFGTDYHSHLGPRRGGLATHGPEGFRRAIHNIENAAFRSKFEKDFETFTGNLGIGCISDYEPQPLLINSHLGSFAITTVGRVKNIPELKQMCFKNGMAHFQEMTNGEINVTELMAAIVNQKPTILEGLKFIHEVVRGSMSVLIMTKEGIYCSRDKLGRMPIIIGQKEDGFCATFESTAFMNLGYHHYKDVGPGEIVYLTPESCTTLKEANEKMQMCAFMWVYYGYPTSTYEGRNVEVMRNTCGKLMARRDSADVDVVAGVPDSGIAHAVGYSNETKRPYGRPFIKYTPTWPRSFTPSNQAERQLIAKMKLIPVHEQIKDKKILLIDDSIVRGTQLGETTQFLYDSGAKEVHIRTACPPILFGCKFLNFSRSSSEMALLSRRIICELEGSNEITHERLQLYSDPDSKEYAVLVEEMRKRLNFTTLDFGRLDELVESIGLEKCKLCTYCWDGVELE